LFVGKTNREIEKEKKRDRDREKEIKKERERKKERKVLWMHQDAHQNDQDEVGGNFWNVLQAAGVEQGQVGEPGVLHSGSFLLEFKWYL
jgi:hypothetical protein